MSKDGFDFDQKKTSEKGKAAWSGCKRSARKQTVPGEQVKRWKEVILMILVMDQKENRNCPLGKAFNPHLRIGLETSC